MTDKEVMEITEYSKKKTKAYCKHIEDRLFAYPILKKIVARCEKDIEDLKIEPIDVRTKDIILNPASINKVNRGENVCSPEEMREGQIRSVEKKMHRCIKELNQIDEALEICVGRDTYKDIINLKYFQQKSDEEIAEVFCCDPSTVRRNKSRLVKKIAVYFYGIDVIGW